MGRIGTQLSERLAPFEVKILHNDIKDERYFYLGGMDKFRTLDKLFSECDVISLHVPLNSETEEMIKGEHLKTMKHGAILINTSRGQIVERESLLRAIRERSLGYGTDVVRDDKEKENLKRLKRAGFNVVVTEHIGGNTAEAIKATREFIINKVAKYIKN